MTTGEFKIAPAKAKRVIDIAKLGSVLDGAVVGQVEVAPEIPVEAPQMQAKPEPKTQAALRLAPSVQARITMMAAQKTAATGGIQTFGKQDIMEQAILEYLDREEKKQK